MNDSGQDVQKTLAEERAFAIRAIIRRIRQREEEIALNEYNAVAKERATALKVLLKDVYDVDYDPNAVIAEDDQ